MDYGGYYYAAAQMNGLAAVSGLLAQLPKQRSCSQHSAVLLPLKKNSAVLLTNCNSRASGARRAAREAWPREEPRGIGGDGRRDRARNHGTGIRIMESRGRGTDNREPIERGEANSLGNK